MTAAENNGSSTGGVTGCGFVPGRSGNPGGRPRGLARRTREVVGDDGRSIAEFWLATMNDPDAKLSDRLEASKLLADRGWGKAAALLALEDGDPSLDPGRLTVEQIDREIARLGTELAEGRVNAGLT